MWSPYARQFASGRRQPPPIVDRHLSIEFAEPGVEEDVVTFG
jgi:hypothetical protein